MQAQARGGAVQDVQHAAVRHHENLLARMAGGEFFHGGHDARLELQQRFTARGREVGHPLAPGQRLLGKALLQLAPGVAFETTKAPFAQAHVRRHGLVARAGDRLRGLQGAQQVAGVAGGDRFVAQGVGQLGRLLATVIVEFDVGVALDARVAVPGGLTVAHGQDAGDLQRVSLKAGGRLQLYR
ncbi:hypothetical protein D9M68_821050 [compost metagenome]